MDLALICILLYNETLRGCFTVGKKKKYQKNVEWNVLNVIDYLYNHTKIKKYTDFLSNVIDVKKLPGILFLVKNFFKGKPVERQGRKARRD